MTEKARDDCYPDGLQPPPPPPLETKKSEEKKGDGEKQRKG